MYVTGELRLHNVLLVLQQGLHWDIHSLQSGESVPIWAGQAQAVICTVIAVGHVHRGWKVSFQVGLVVPRLLGLHVISLPRDSLSVLLSICLYLPLTDCPTHCNRLQSSVSLIVSPHYPHLLRDGMTQLHLDTRTCKSMYPQPLRIAESVILGLDFREHDFLPLRVPQEQVRDTAATLLIFLRHDLADSRQSLPFEAIDYLEKVIDLECPIYANNTGLLLFFSRVDVLQQRSGSSVANLHYAAIDFRCSRWEKSVGV